jgi:hypothetical protein
MKKLVQVQEVDGEGLVGLMGQRVTFFCMNYIYVGTLTGVNTNDILLEDPAVVYETGSFDSKEFKDAQKLPNSLYLRISAIESYSVLDKE